MNASIAANDAARVEALERYRLLDSSAEEPFDALTRLAAGLCGAPIALISLVDEDRQWFKSCVGLDGFSETPRTISFCTHAIEGNEIFEIPDASRDPRFASNPLVTGELGIRFYAGVPLRDRDGFALGTLCVLDRIPRRLDAGQRTALQAIAAAITDAFEGRLEALAASAQAQQRIALLSAATQSSSEGIVIAQPTPGDPSEIPARIVYANEAFLRQKGADMADVVDAPLEIFSGPKTDRKRIRSVFMLLLSGESARFELLTYRKDGSEYWCDVAARPLMGSDGSVTHVVFVTRDITETVLRELTLETQNERLTRLTSIARGLFSALEPRALIEALRAGVRELTGGRSLLYAALGEGGFAVTNDLAAPDRAAATGDDVVMQSSQSDMPIVADDGLRITARVLGSSGVAAYVLDVRAMNEARLSTADTFAVQLLCQYFAVAARNVELYSELSARRASVTELNQIKNDLIAMLAHDFKGPLTTIVGFADVLAENDALDDEARTFCSLISSSAMRLAGLATDTLALSRLESNELALTLSDVDVSSLVGEVARTFSVTRAIDVRVDRNAPIVLRADASRLRQVFENLIGNAIKYSPGGEPVEVVIRRVTDGAEIAIRDRGIGIPAADRQKLFGRFARASNARSMGISGTGFGLYLSKTIVELHGGRIAVESREGVGSTFRIVIPTSFSDAQAAASRRILLLDRDGEARSYIAHTLRAAGYAVRVTIGQSDTLAALRDEIFDVAIIDLDRIDLEPPAFLHRLSAAARKRTGFVWLGALAEFRAHDHEEYLQKPFLIRDLQRAVDAAMRRAGAATERARSARA